MKVDDIVLMAYVDNELSSNDRQKVELEIRAHAQIAEQVALLEASRLSYCDAFANQKIPPVPAGLTKHIEEMVWAHAARPAAYGPADGLAATGANDSTIGHDARAPQSARVRSSLRIAPTWLAVAFVAGAFCWGVAQHFAPGLDAGRVTLASSAMGNAPWVQVATSYQQLISRDTVGSASPDTALSARTVDAIHRVDGIAVRIPDLSKAGLKFVSVRRLRFRDRPLIQILYLPEKGQPVALCVIKEKKPDQALTSQRIDNMNVVTWRQAELAYALIGTSSDGELAGLGNQISRLRFDPLFGST